MGYGEVSEGSTSDREYLRAEDGVYVVRLVGVKPFLKTYNGVTKPSFRIILATSRMNDRNGNPFVFNREVGVKYSSSPDPTYHTHMSTIIEGVFGRLITDAEYLALAGEEPHPPLEHLFGYEFKATVEYVRKPSKKRPGEYDEFNNITKGPFMPAGHYLDYDNVMSGYTKWWLDEKPERERKAAEYAAKNGGAKPAGAAAYVPNNDVDDPFSEQGEPDPFADGGGIVI